MASMDELLSSLTEEDGIREDFVEAVRKAYDDDMSASITATGDLETALSEANSAAEIAANEHAAEMTALKASFFDQIRNGNVVTEVEDDVVIPDIVEDNDSFYQEV